MQVKSITSAVWMHTVRRLAHAAGGLAVCLSSALASAGVSYTVTDLPDTTPGQDLWRYQYSIGGPLAAFNAINLLFAPTDYSDLSVIGSTARVSALAAQPDPTFPADGMLTVTALNLLLATDVETVDLDFIWLGGTGRAPGAQDYQVLDENFIEVGSARTRLTGTQGGPQVVPEPSPLALLAAAVLALLTLRRCELPFHRRSR